jgi:cadmium resistance protein CadD (predicted permease)
MSRLHTEHLTLSAPQLGQVLAFSGILEPQYEQLVIELVVVKLGLILILISGRVGSLIKCHVE